MADPIYPHFDKEEGIAHLGTNVFWTEDVKSMEIFLKAVSRHNSIVISLSCRKNDEMFFAIGKEK